MPGVGWFALLLVLVATAAFAGPVREYEEAFRSAYADYRAALFMTNSKNVEASTTALNTFRQKWSAIEARWSASPPPQYADDPSWPKVMQEVKRILDQADAAVRAGKLADAHEILEAFRDVIGALHARNDVLTFSDRMNAYHARMEEVLQGNYGGFDAGGRSRLSNDMAVLGYLAEELGRNPPAESRDSTEFKGLLTALQASVAAVQTALRAGDAAGIKQAVAGLKPAYSKFFLRFG